MRLDAPVFVDACTLVHVLMLLCLWMLVLMCMYLSGERCLN